MRRVVIVVVAVVIVVFIVVVAVVVVARIACVQSNRRTGHENLATCRPAVKWLTR